MGFDNLQQIAKNDDANSTIVTTKEQQEEQQQQRQLQLQHQLNPLVSESNSSSSSSFSLMMNHKERIISRKTSRTSLSSTAATATISNTTSSRTRKEHTKKKRTHKNDNGSANGSRNGSRPSSGTTLKSKKKNNRCWKDFLEAVFIYVACITLPVILGIIVKWYESIGLDDDGATRMEDDDDNYYYDHNPNNQQTNHVGSTSTLTSTSILIHYVTIILSHIINSSLVQRIIKLSIFDHLHLSSLSEDVKFLFIATILQSLVRVMLVHLLVPRYLVPRRLVALVRNKSTHLLSASAYDWKKENEYENQSNDEKGYGQAQLQLHQLQQHQEVLTKKQELIHYMSDTLIQTGHSFRRSLGHESCHETTSPTLSPKTLLTKRTLHDTNPNNIVGHDMNDNDFNTTSIDFDDKSHSLSPVRQHRLFQPTTTGTVSRHTLPKIPSLSPPISPNNDEYDNLDAIQALRLFSAPRYATAVFRLLCCSLSCIWALTHFRDASYWPIWVGGSSNGSTKYCWDLSGNVGDMIALGTGSRSQSGVDQDFDNQNLALRYFFLGQASYQLQSLCFHFLSILLLILSGRGGSKGNETGAPPGTYNNLANGEDSIISARSSFKSYIRPIVEHSLYFGLTLTTFFFSALRRLGSISIFALELSSLVLQLLQICINAPEKSKLQNPKVIKFVHHYLAVPVFVYSRFFVIPFVVQYSAIYESKVWLKQLEHALLPHVGTWIFWFLNFMLFSSFGLNFVYLRRLLFHPILEKISNKGQRTMQRR